MCVFCDIAGHRAPAMIVYEDALCMAFLDADPIAEGHTLLIPKAHYLDADDLPDELFAHLMRVSQKIIWAIKHAYKPMGYSVMHNGGMFNDVGHYHLHIFPRWMDDGFAWSASELQHEVSDAVVEKIRKEMN